MSELAKMEFVPCLQGMPPLKGKAIEGLLGKLGNNWQVIEEQRLAKDYRFKDFRQALDFTNRVGEMAESVNHHPDIYLAWGKVRLTIWTHEIGGLCESDFVFAAKVDELFPG